MNIADSRKSSQVKDRKKTHAKPARTRPRKVRVINQLAETECGLCCAAMVLTAWGQKSSVARLRRAYETGRDGLDLTRIADVLREQQMEVTLYSASLDGLKQLQLPVIAYWEQSHVVVIEKVNDTNVVVVDPARGRCSMPLDEFSEKFSGIVLAPVPGEQFQANTKSDPSVWRIFLAAAAERRATILQAGALSVVMYAVVLGIPMATERAVDSYAQDQDLSPSLLALVVSVPLLGYVGISFLRAVLVSGVVVHLGRTMMSSTFGKLLRLPFKYFAHRSQGELAYRLSSVNQVRDLLSAQVTTVLLDVGTLAVALTFVMSRSLTLGAVTAGLVAIMVFTVALSYRPVRRVTDQEIHEATSASSVQLESMGSMEALKVSGMTDDFLARWKEIYERALGRTKQRMILQGAVSSISSGIQVFGPFIVMLVGLQLVISGATELGAVVASQTLTATALGTVTSLSGSFTQFIQAHAQVDRLADIIHQDDEPQIFGSQDIEVTGRLEIDHLSFSYPGSEAQVLSDVSLTAEAGERVAIVGPSGSGKSTISKVLTGIYPAPDAAAIRVDGHELSQMSAESFYGALAYVPQEIRLSNRTIAENIDFRAGPPDMDRVLKAAESAGLQRDIAQMPMGYYTQVREMGGSLSGGQRQRLALARALAREPRILVLDEATSAMDTLTENRITSALREMKCTQIVIAHRLSTVKDADRILVLDQGRIVESGSHDALIRVDGLYRQLVHGQSKMLVDDVDPSELAAV